MSMTGSLSASEIYVAGSGLVAVAPEDTALPADITAPGSAWDNMGYTDDTGIEYTFGKTTAQITGWQNFNALRTITTEAAKSLKFTLLQANIKTMMLALGGGSVPGPSTTQAGRTYTPPASSAIDVRAILITSTDGANVWGFYAPRVMLGDNVVIPWNKTTAAVLPLTFDVQAAATPPDYQFVFPAIWVTDEGTD